MITPGDLDDRKLLEYKPFVEFIHGKLVGDKEYIGRNLFERQFVDGIQLITKLKSDMKGSLHSRHRTFDNFIVNLLSCIAAYCCFPKKPCINVSRAIGTQLAFSEFIELTLEYAFYGTRVTGVSINLSLFFACSLYMTAQKSFISISC